MVVTPFATGMKSGETSQSTTGVIMGDHVTIHCGNTATTLISIGVWSFAG
jgi:hypothetical protein